MPRCSVLLCRNDSRSVNVSNGGVSYHRYPKDPATKEKWIDSTGRANWFPKPSSVICSEHFEPEDFLLSKKGYKHIRDNAVPTRKFLSFHDRTPAVLKLNSETTDDLDDDDALPLASAPVGGTPGARRKRAAGCSTPTSSLKSQKKAGSDSAKPKSDESDSLDEVDYENLSLKEKELEGMFRYEKNVIEKQAIKMKNLKRKLRRLKTTLTDMEDLYKVLEEKCHISNEDLMYLRSTQVKVSELVVRRQTNVELSEVVSKLTYSVEFRRFALTLHFTSAAAYDYVRKMFKTSLPYPMTLKHWYLTVNGEPGFTKEAFVAMKRKADASNRPIVATLAVDDMSLNRRVEVDGKLYGYVDVGTGLDTDMLEEAREVLALSITAVNGHFSVPIAYFQTSTVTSEQRAKLVKFGIEMARDAGINIVALSFEENHSNMNMVRQLKCETKFRDGHITYNHPDMAPIIVILDPSKLLERLERAFRNYETLIDKDGNKIQWMFIKELIEVRYLNGINGQIVDFQNTRVKVKLATELFSSKIAEALQYCRIDLGLKAFKDSEPTQTFITICSTFYEVFNSINSHVYGYKNILNKNNAAQIFEFLNMATDYITNLNVKNIGPVIRNPKESLSFVAGIKQLYMMMFQTNILDGLPLYKLSLDHLKHIFWNIKEDAKCNIETNPTPKKEGEGSCG